MQAGQIAVLTAGQEECQEKHRQCEEKNETMDARVKVPSNFGSKWAVESESSGQ